MEKIIKYINNFKKHNKMNAHYTMRSGELSVTTDEARTDTSGTLILLFEFGYVKGYRAALAEMKNGANKVTPMQVGMNRGDEPK